MTPDVYTTLAGRLALDVYEVYVAKLIDRFDQDLVRLVVGADQDDERASHARGMLRDGLYQARHEAVELLGTVQRMNHPNLRFELGRLVITDGIGAVRPDAPERARELAFESHGRGHWGNITGREQAANEIALRSGGRLMSRYQRWLNDGDVLVITEADRSMTTVLTAGEY